MSTSLPVPAAELEAAVRAAVFAVALDAAFKYGLIEPDPQVDLDRCAQVIADAQEHGIAVPTIEEILP